MTALAKVIERSRREKESWRYTDLEKLLAAPRAQVAPAAAKIRASQGPKLVFIDGILQTDRSHMLGLPQNTEINGTDGVYEIVIQKEACLIMQPLELVFVGMGAAETSTRLKITLGESASLPLLERHEGSGSAFVMATEIILKKQAKLSHAKIMRGCRHIASTNVRIEEGAFYDNFTLLKGGEIVRNEIDALLSGKLAQCTLNGAMLARGNDHLDSTTRITHAAPFGTSREFYKSVVDGRARAVFQGKIRVEPHAQKTDGHQLSRALLLSDQAEMDAKPELEIYADDVKCSHGSTVGFLDDAALFYLQSRGIPDEEARALLIAGFVGEIVDDIKAPELRAACQTEVEEWLHG